MDDLKNQMEGVIRTYTELDNKMADKSGVQSQDPPSLGIDQHRRAGFHARGNPSRQRRIDPVAGRYRGDSRLKGSLELADAQTNQWLYYH